MPWGVKATEMLTRICAELNSEFERGWGGWGVFAY